ncbi:MAG: hypothetical protein KF770_22535 [Anaerolineae bacterium]|nr:hypothetical protein [Anaerolineae bacterium]
MRTKFYRPPVPENLTLRPRLIGKLNQAATRPLTLLSAPPGFGKSTLVSAWLRQWRGPAAWLSLDQNDNDRRLFLAYFLAAVSNMAPEMGTATQTLLDGPVLPPTAVLVANLINDLDDLSQDVVLVLDDYHVISNRDIHNLVAALLNHPPRFMHLVIATRHDPLLPRAFLLAQGKMVEIRAPELALTLAETAVYLQQTLPTPPDPAIISALHIKTEGWIAGLRLAVLSLPFQADADSLAAHFQANNRMTMDYLVAEALAQQPPEFQTALLQISILERFSRELCTAVCWPANTADAAENGQKFIAWLEKMNLFLVPLDEEREWYRFHHLFKDLLHHQLRQRYNLAQVDTLHGRAGRWFAQHKLPIEAIQHALAAHDTGLAVQIVAERRQHLMNREKWPLLNRWLHLFPPELVDQEPELLLLRAWIYYSQWRYADLPPILERLENLLAQAPEVTAVRLGGEVAVLRSQQYFWTQQAAKGLECGQHALAQLPADHSHARGVAWVFLSGSRYLMGDMAAAITQTQQALAAEQGLPGAMATRLLPALGFLHLAAANMPDLTTTANRLLWLAEERGLAESSGWANHFLGAAAYCQDHLAAAESHFLEVVRRRYVVHGHAYAQSGFGLALTYQAQGRLAEAVTMAADITNYWAEMKNAPQHAKAQTFQAHLALLQGETALALSWLDQTTRPRQLTPMMEFYTPEMTWGRALLELGKWAEAEAYLNRVQPFLESTHNSRFLVETLAQRAWLNLGQGKRDTAVATLKQAISLAAQTRLIHPLADYAVPLHPLWDRLARQQFMPEYLARIQMVPNLTVQPAHGGPPPPTNGHPLLIEPLTNREMDVLTLMEKRLTNKEIAQELCISVVTVKRHTYNLYQKLGVHGRRQAVNEARKLGVIP